MKILFVCRGNICRSPMAEAYMRHRATRAGLSHVTVESAGTLNIIGAPASDEAIRIVGEHGIDLTRHRSRGLTARMLRESDHVIVMTGRQKDEIADRFPGKASGPIRLIREFESGSSPVGDAPDLHDPIGMPEDFYRVCFEMIRTCVDHLVIHLRHAP